MPDVAALAAALSDAVLAALDEEGDEPYGAAFAALAAQFGDEGAELLVEIILARRHRQSAPTKDN